MAKSKSAKRRNQQNRSAQKHAQKRAHRAQTMNRQHLPKVGTKADSAYVARRRREDLVDFGLGHRRRSTRAIGAAVIGVIVVALVLFMVFVLS